MPPLGIPAHYAVFPYNFLWTFSPGFLLLPQRAGWLALCYDNLLIHRATGMFTTILVGQCCAPKQQMPLLCCHFATLFAYLQKVLWWSSIDSQICAIIILIIANNLHDIWDAACCYYYWIWMKWEQRRKRLLRSLRCGGKQAISSCWVVFCIECLFFFFFWVKKMLLCGLLG